MEAHRIGQQLRAVVLRDRQEGLPFDPRRLQAVIADVCAGGQQDLVAPLRYLVLSAAFASAAASDPPLADVRQLQRLQNELGQMYAAPLCARLQPLLEGLLGLPPRLADPAGGSVGSPSGMAGAAAASGSGVSAAAVSAAVGPVPGAAPAGPTVAAVPVVVSAAGSSGASALTIVLALLSGVLLMALAGVGVLLWQRQSAVVRVSPAVATPDVAATATPPASIPTLAAPAPLSPAPAATPLAAEDQGPAAVDRAVDGIQQLYQALSAKDFNQAQTLYGSAAADQFDPSFFRQFERVSVQDLRTTSRSGTTVNLEGVITFVWPDGSVQRESRTFSVDSGSVPAVITGSEFVRVLTPRG